MDRLACLDIPALPLQLLLKRQPSWRTHPVAVVSENKPLARIVWVNEAARHQRVLPGMRYAAALSLSRRLKASSVSEREVEQALAQLMHELRNFTPEVEPSSDTPGVFWLNASGLLCLHTSLENWGQKLRGHLKACGFDVSLALGFTRFGTYAAAKTNPATIVSFISPHAETRALQKAPLVRLDLEPEARQSLNQLGVTTMAGLLQLPHSDVLERFGPELAALHRLAAGESWAPLMPEPLSEPVLTHVLLEPPEQNTHRLLFSIKHHLHSLLARVRTEHKAVIELALRLKLDHQLEQHECLRPAAPTLDVPQLVDLVRLRLESSPLPTAVLEFELELAGVRVYPEQLHLFAQAVRHRTESANRAFARIRAEFGEASVCRARLGDGHLPEARFCWKPLRDAPPANHSDRAPNVPDLKQQLPYLFPQPSAPSSKQVVVPISNAAHAGCMPPLRGTVLKPEAASTRRQLIRRVFLKPQPWSGKAPELKRGGPYLLEGGWWRRRIRREYYFVQSSSGLLWCFFDPEQKRWFVHGEVD